MADTTYELQGLRLKVHDLGSGAFSFTTEEESMKRIQRLLTSSELKNLIATPVTVLPPPGPGLFYALHPTFAFYTFGTTPYNLQGHSVITIGTPTADQNNLYLPGLLNAPVNTIYTMVATEKTEPATAWVNQPLSLSLRPGSELTEGDGTLLIILYYTIEGTT